MKKMRLIVFLLICFTVSLVSVAQASMGDVLLKVGSRGADVVELQTKLNDVGFNSGNADGIFGRMTNQAVIDYQLSYGLDGDGLVGSLTSKSLNDVYSAKHRQNKADAVIATAKKYIGVPYIWGGMTPDGFDCSGFTQYVFAKNGITIPRVSRDQFTVGTSVSIKNLQAGDLIFFSMKHTGIVSHVGIYIGNGQFINSSSSGGGVIIYQFNAHWQSFYVGAKRVL